MVAKALEPLTPLIAAGLGFQAANLGSKIFKRLAGFAFDPKSVPTIAANNLSTGGEVRGGKGGIDDVEARLTRGEFVINRQAARKNKDLLLAINSNKEIPMFNDGGPVENISSHRLKGFFEKQKMPQSIYDDINKYGVSIKRAPSITNIDPSLDLS